MRLTLVESDFGWPAAAAEEAELVREALGAVRVEHIGSTAVPGLVAKPVIDLLAGLEPLSVGPGVPAMEALGYEYLGENGIPGREFFRKGGDERTHHVHAVEVGGPLWRGHLVFRDYLRARPDEAERYGAAKRELAAAADGDWDAYVDAKQPIAGELQSRALVWAAENWPDSVTESAQPGTHP